MIKAFEFRNYALRTFIIFYLKITSEFIDYIFKGGKSNQHENRKETTKNGWIKNNLNITE